MQFLAFKKFNGGGHFSEIPLDLCNLHIQYINQYLINDLKEKSKNLLKCASEMGEP